MRRLPDANPQAGDVYFYPYIWQRQPTGAICEKDRPCCVALRLPKPIYGVDVYMLAISTSGFPEGGDGIQIPKAELECLSGFDSNVPHWLTTSEFNATIHLDGYFSAMEYRGSLSNEFLKLQVIPKVRNMIAIAFEKNKMGK